MIISQSEVLAQSLTGPQRAAIDMITAGHTLAQSASAAGVSRMTLYRWLKGDAAFIASFNAWQSDMLDTARGRLLALTELAVTTIEKSITAGDARTALKVLDKIGALERATPGSTDAVTVTSSATFSVALNANNPDTEIDVSLPPCPAGAVQELEMAGPADANFAGVPIPAGFAGNLLVHPMIGLSPQSVYAFRLRTEQNGLSTYSTAYRGQTASSGSSGSSGGSNGLPLFVAFNPIYTAIGVNTGGGSESLGLNGYGGSSGTGTVMPAAPANLTATPVEINGVTSVRLLWDNTPDNETGFDIERSTDGGSTWTQLPQTGADVPFYIDSGSPTGAPLTYQVASYIGTGAPQWSQPATTGSPAVPTDLTATADNDDGQVDLQWTDNESQLAAGYQIQWSSDGVNFYTIDTVPAVAGHTVYSYTDTSPTVDGDETNCYRIVAYQTAFTTDSDELDSDASNQMNAVVVAPPDAVDDTDGGTNAAGGNSPYLTPPGHALSVPDQLGITQNDYDPQDDPQNFPLTVASFTYPVAGAAAHGTLSVDPGGGFVYSPNPGFTGTDSFTYVDTNGTVLSNTATVDIDVLARPVITNPDSYSTNFNQPLTELAAALGTNDVNPDGTAITYSQVAGAGPSYGTVVVNQNGSFTYTPGTNFVGLDHFQYQVTYNGTTLSNPSNVVISVGTAHYTAPTVPAGTVLNPPPDLSSYSNSLQGVWGAWTVAHNLMGQLAVAIGNFGQASQACTTIDATTAGSPVAQDLIDSASAAQALVDQAYARYAAALVTVQNVAAKYQKTVWYTDSDDAKALAAVEQLPTTLMGVGPTADQLQAYQSAFQNYANGCDFMVNHNTFVVQTATKVHDLLQTTIQVAGIASIAVTGAEILTQQGCDLFVKYALQQIESTVQGIFYAQVSQQAVALSAQIAQAFGIQINPDYLRIAADATQVICLARAARAEQLKNNSGCFSGTTLVDTANHGEEDEDDIVLGERVDTSVSETAAQGGPAPSLPSQTQVDPATWRQVNLTMPNPAIAGDNYHIQLLEPLTWIASNNAAVGGEVDLDLPEMGISGEATVTSIEACPTIESGAGQVVLGTFEHVSNDVVDVNLAGESQPLMVTANHPLWSLDTGGWVEAGQLYSGERLAGASGPVTVTSVTPDSQTMPVYNLDVENDHRYLVTDQGLLVHNTCPGSPHSASAALDRTVVDKNWARQQLRTNMTTTFGSAALEGMEAHHAIPLELLKDPTIGPVIKMAAEAGFNINGVENGLIVPEGHGPHTEYTNYIADEIKSFLGRGAGTPVGAKALLDQVVASVDKSEINFYFGS